MRLAAVANSRRNGALAPSLAQKTHAEPSARGKTSKSRL